MIISAIVATTTFILLFLIGFLIKRRSKAKKEIEKEKAKFNNEKISVESACQIIKAVKTTTTITKEE